MTNGTVVVLGSTGKNFGAGMTGGQAYVLDEEALFETRYNRALIKLERLTIDDIVVVQELIYKHLEATDSARARWVLATWPEFGPKFWKVTPISTPAPAVEEEPQETTTPAESIATKI